MRVYVWGPEGGLKQLPELIKWDICHGFGEACDSFEGQFIYKYGMIDQLHTATDIRAEHDGRVVFRGRVDEFRVEASSAGCTVELSARGLQALMLDCEAESADYYGADLDYILSRHVHPLGITDVDCGSAAGTAALFTVESGESHWGVLREFAEFCCGVKPRFSPEGRLVIDGEQLGRELKIDHKTAVKSIVYGEERYGVISRVRVKKYSSGVAVDVENPEFIALGGQCERVINVPKRTSYDAMRYTGEYQIKRSMEGYQTCQVVLPQCFAAFPGDRVKMEGSPIGLTGEFIVTATCCRGSGDGAVTEIEMRKI